MSTALSISWSNTDTWSELLSQIAQLTWIEDEVGNLLFCNKDQSTQPCSTLDFLNQKLHEEDKYSFQLQYQTGHLQRKAFEIRARYKIESLYHWHLFKFTPSAIAGEGGRNWYGTATDEQNRYDFHLRESISAPSFKELANAMPQLVWVAESNGEVIYYNDRISEFSGARINDSGNWSWEAMMHEEDIQKTADAWSFSLATGNRYEIEHRTLMRNGEYRWMLSRGFPVKNNQGEVLRWYGTATDIHAIKTAEALGAAREAEVLEAKNKLELSISAGRIGLWNWKTKSGELYWSEQMCELYGIKLSDWNSRIESFQEMVLEEDMQRIFEVASKANIEMPEVSYRFRIRRKDGQIRWIEARSRSVFNERGEPEQLIGVNIDITDQMQAAEAIQESELRFKLLAESLPQLIWMTDPAGNILYHSNNWFKYTGKNEFENLWQQTIHPDDLAISSAVWDKAKAASQAFRYEVRLLNAKGEYRWHLSVAEPVKDKDGQVEKWIGAISDITEQKDSTSKLEDLVQKRTVELTRSNEDLQQFAHVASHDLKEPVRKIQLFMNLLRSEFKDSLPGAADFYFQKITKSVARMNSMIDGVLRYSGVEANDSGKDAVNVNKLLANVKEDLELLIKEKQATIIFDEFPVWPMHEILAYQLFYNLIYNSLKFTREGVLPEIKVQLIKNTEQKGLWMRVRDNGIGFDAEENQNIFRTFRRLHSKDQFEGSGLGLALCKKIVERHGGSISAEGFPDKGAAFTLFFPENY
eukprot:gene4004-5731_t